MRFGEDRNDWPFRRVRSIGRRGAYLVFQGILYGFYGLTLHLSDGSGLSRVLELIAPLHVWGVAWIAVGLVALLAAVLPDIRPLHLEPIAFAALMALATVWSVGILLVYLLPGSPGASPIIVAMLFGSLMASTSVVAGWEELK